MRLPAEDAIAILQLVTRADACATARDAEGYADLFTANATMDGAMGTARGRAELRETVARIWARETPDTLHVTANAVIETASAETTVQSVMLMVLPGHEPSLLGAAHVRQTMVRTGDGWRISRRSITTPPSQTYTDI